MLVILDVLYMSEENNSEVLLMNFVLGEEAHIGSYIRRNIEKLMVKTREKIYVLIHFY